RWGLDSRFCGNDGLRVSVFSDGFLLRWGLDSRLRGNDGGGGFGFFRLFILRLRLPLFLCGGV
ncbi:TPA: hypothetical protein ACFN7M_001386, partial [Neisseria meningitidis]